MENRTTAALALFMAFLSSSLPAAEKKVGLKIGIEPAPLAKSFEAVAFGPLVAGGADPLAAAPAGVRLAFDGAALAAEVRPREAQVIVLPVPSYKKLLVGEARKGFADHLEHLQNLVSGAGRLSGFLEPVPRPGESLRFRARVEMLEFAGGRAVRFVGGYARHPGGPPVLAYTVQGVTSDQLFLVTLFWPVKVAGFSAVEDPDAERSRPRRAAADGVRTGP